MSGDVTRLLEDWVQNKEGALDRLLPAVLPELQLQARRHLASERVNHTLQPTEIVHEAFLRLVSARVVGFASRGHFFAFASKLIRDVLVEHARSRSRQKRGAAAEHLSIDEVAHLEQGTVDLDKILIIDQGLEHLRQMDPRQSQVAEMRFFAGLTMPEIADVMGLSTATVERLWSVARLRLGRALSAGTQGTESRDSS